MRKFILALFIIPTFNTLADGFWCPDESNAVRFPKPTGKECFSVPMGFDPQTATVINSGGTDVLIVDQDKANAVAAQKAQDAQKKSDELVRIGTCLNIYKQIEGVSDIASLKPVLHCLAGDAPGGK